MTREKWAAMSHRQRRIKIAGLLGITEVSEADAATCDVCEIGSWDGKKKGMPVDVPDYENDLNAMHEATMLVPVAKMQQWLDNIVMIVGHDSEKIELCWKVWHATAAQRAEALALTLEPEE